MSIYYPTNVPTTDDIFSLERWLRDEHSRLGQHADLVRAWIDFIATNYVIAAYGGIGLDNPTALSTINATPQVLPFDVELVSGERGISYDLANNGMRFETVGIWRVNAKVSLTFTELNAGRQMRLSIFNATQGTTPSTFFNFAVGRNTDGVNLNFNLLVDAPEANIGDLLQLRVDSVADTFTGVQAIGSVWDANHVGEYKGDFFEGRGRTQSLAN